LSKNNAFEFVQLLARELSSGTVDLPGFPEVFSRVCRALDDPQHTTEQIARIIVAEPALAARILTTANSAAFNHSGQAIADMRSAITRLGGNSVRSAASAFAVSQVKHQASLKSVLPRLDALWEKSTHVAAICHVVGRTCKVNPDEALLTGLLHGVGSLYLIVRTAERTDLFAMGGTGGSIEDLTDEWNAAITKSILENWDFPEQIINAAGDQDDCQRKHHGAADLTDVLICAKTLACYGNDPVQLRASFEHTPAFLQLGLAQDRCMAVLKHAELQIGAMREVLGT
jgi:HD-like signal output (HDOD) protein